jgi:hypothetical protein
LVLPKNFPVGGVFESTRRFQVASAASIKPARRPTRGSGLGAVADMLPAGDGAPPGAEVERVHAASDSSPTASDSDASEGTVGDTREWRARCVEATADSSVGAA